MQSASTTFYICFILLHNAAMASICSCTSQPWQAGVTVVDKDLHSLPHFLCSLHCLMPLLMPFRHFAALCGPHLLRGSQASVECSECAACWSWMLHAVHGHRCSVGPQKAPQKLAAGRCSQNSLACLGLAIHRKVQGHRFLKDYSYSYMDLFQLDPCHGNYVFAAVSPSFPFRCFCRCSRTAAYHCRKAQVSSSALL